MRKWLILASSVLFVGYVSTASAADESKSSSDQAQSQSSTQNGAMGSPSQNGSMGAPAGGFQWPSATTGKLEVKKGKIDKFQAGQIETGGILGLGGEDLSVTNDTMIVSEDGKKLSQADLKAGREIASIYKEDTKADKNVALVVIVGRGQSK